MWADVDHADAAALGLDEGIADGIAGQHAVAAVRAKASMELVVGENHEVLEMLWVRAGVVVEPVQRVVDARGAKQRERRWRSRWQLRCDSSMVARSGVSNMSRSGRSPAGMFAGLIGEVDRDRLIRFADRPAHCGSG